MLTWCQWGWRKPHLLHELFSVDSMMIRTWWWEWRIWDYVASCCIESWQCGLQWRETRRIWHFTKGNRHGIASRALCAWPISTSRVHRHSRRTQFGKLKYDLIKWLLSNKNSTTRLSDISSFAITWILTLSGLCDQSWHFLLQMVYQRYLLKSSAAVFGINLLVLHH